MNKIPAAGTKSKVGEHVPMSLLYALGNQTKNAAPAMPTTNSSHEPYCLSRTSPQVIFDSCDVLVLPYSVNWVRHPCNL